MGSADAGLAGDDAFDIAVDDDGTAAKGKGGDGAAFDHTRQVVLFLRFGAKQADGPRAQALHGKGKVGQRGMKSQGFTQNHQRTRIELR